MGNVTEKLSLEFATNQLISPAPHIKPDTIAGATQFGIWGLCPLARLMTQYTPKYTNVARNMPQKCEKT